MEAYLNQIEDFKFEFCSATGHKAVLDGPQSLGGKNEGLRPMELILGGLAGCSAFDILSILKKSKQPVEDIQVEIKANRREEVPKIFTDIHLSYKVTGKISEKQLQRAINLSVEKYCSVSKMLEPKVKITTSYLILDENHSDTGIKK